MHSLATLFVSITLLASQTWAASINAHPAKAARWLHVPRTLQDPDQFKRSNLDAREYAGFSPLEKKELFARQGCDPATQTTCAGGNQCCPGADACYTYNGNQVGCCPIPNICTGPPTGCADANSVECPANIGGCCPIGQACYLDTTGIARCDSTGLYSTSISAGVTPTNTTTPSIANITATVTPATVTVTGTTSPAQIAGASNTPAIVTTKSGAESRAQIGTSALIFVVAGFVAFA